MLHTAVSVVSIESSGSSSVKWTVRNGTGLGERKTTLH